MPIVATGLIDVGQLRVAIYALVTFAGYLLRSEALKAPGGASDSSDARGQLSRLAPGPPPARAGRAEQDAGVRRGDPLEEVD